MAVADFATTAEMIAAALVAAGEKAATRRQNASSFIQCQ